MQNFCILFHRRRTAEQSLCDLTALLQHVQNGQDSQVGQQQLDTLGGLRLHERGAIDDSDYDWYCPTEGEKKETTFKQQARPTTYAVIQSVLGYGGSSEPLYALRQTQIMRQRPLLLLPLLL